MKKLALSLIGIALLLAVTPCHATPITFANFTNLGTQDVSLILGAGPTDTLQVLTMPIEFTFFNVPAASLGEMAAHLYLSASTTTAGTLIGGIFIQQPSYGGSFTITRDSDSTVLLSGTFTSANLSGLSGGTSVEFGASDATGATVVFSSPYVTFSSAPGATQAFSISMSSVNPILTLNAQNFINSFAASETGTFSADIVPEPLSLLLLGSGLVGLGLLRRRRK